MANQAFQTLATNPLKAQPVAAGKIVIRSTSSDDDSNITVFGTVAAAADSELLSMGGEQEVETTSEFSAISQVIVDPAAAGVISGYAPGVAAVGDIRTDINPLDGATIEIGLVGATVAYRFKDTMAAAYDVQIGSTKEDTTENLKLAINAAGTPGSEYFAGTLINPFVSADHDVNVIELTDRIPCNRALGWEIVESASNFSKRIPLGGVDGLLLFSIPVGGTFAADSLTFSTEDHLTETLPALMTGTSAHVTVSGGVCMVRIWGDNAVKWKMQGSTDLINWTDTSEGEQTLSASTMTYLTLAQLQEYVRFVLTENTNTDGTILDARLIF
jgi:hypothetical protein